MKNWHKTAGGARKTDKLPNYSHTYFKYDAVVVALMQSKKFVLKEKRGVRKASMPTGRPAESTRRLDKQLIREILDRRHDVSVILS